VGLGLATWQFVDKSRAYRRAKTEAVKSQQVAKFLKDMLEGVSPSVALGRDTTMLQEIADKTAQHVSTDLKGQPEVEVELRLTLAKLYYELQLVKEAEAMARQTLRLAHEHFGEEHFFVADALCSLGAALIPIGEFDEAEQCLRRAIAMQRKLRGEDSVQEGYALSLLAQVLRESKLGDAETAIRTGLAIYRKQLGNNSREVASALQRIAPKRLLPGRGFREQSKDTLRQKSGYPGRNG
jgi:tetratricopeptide (TPR) repeat protein